MMFKKRLLALGFFLAIQCGAEPFAATVSPKKAPPLDPDVAATIVVFNERDPASTELAGRYAEKRGIPLDHLIGLSCSINEEISRAEYEQTIAEPLKKVMIGRDWWHVEPDKGGMHVASSSIRFVALMRGIPLKVRAIPAGTSYPGDRPENNATISAHNEASVDSELATLGSFMKQISGFVDNPYYRSFAPLADASLPGLLLVCRLDGPDGATVDRMLDDSLVVEKTGLWGMAYVDTRHLFEGDYAMGDEWMRAAASDLMKHGIPCVEDDQPEVFQDHYPMNQVALYFGWYATEVEGPFKDEHFKFMPGAVAVHLYSFSASSLKSGWCSTLLKRGAAVTLGNVYEPYLAYTPNLDLFEGRLRSGFTFAEAAYASERVLSWMTTFVGDPLYRPFKAMEDVTATPSAPSPEWAAYREASQLWFSKGRAVGEHALQAKGRALKSGMIFEGLGSLQAGVHDSEAALRSWDQAAKFYTNPVDKTRCALHSIDSFRTDGKTSKALALTRQQLASHPDAGTATLLKAIELQLAPPPPHR